MSNMLEHRGYLGSVLYSDEDETFHGRLEFIRDLVTYEANDAVGLKSAFQEAVDDYLLLCEEQKRAPDIPRNIRPEGSLHSAAMLRARLEGVSLNAVLTLIALVSCGTLIFLMWTGVEGGGSGKWQVSRGVDRRRGCADHWDFLVCDVEDRSPGAEGSAAGGGGSVGQRRGGG